MATIKDVALRAGVSIGTVSNVLAGSPTVTAELRQRVQDAIQALDYHPSHVARSLASRNTFTLGMVVTDITNPFFPLLIKGAESRALELGYILSVFNTDNSVERERQCLTVLRTRRADGVLLVSAPNAAGEIRHLTDAQDAGLTLLCVDRLPGNLKCDAVLVDNAKGAQVCVRHLNVMGHRRIAAILGPDGLLNAEQRSAGFRQALRECGLKADASLERQGDFRVESGHRLAKDLILSQSPPTAIFAANGMMGLGALKAIQELGLSCPEHMSLAVFDDYPGADVFRPSLTVISQPVYEMGRRATEILVERITGQRKSSRPYVEILEPELLVRESTGPPRRS
jgi:LacI family transcriptional regulator